MKNIKFENKYKKDLVSVVFPTMNRKEDLIKCIESIKNSTYPKIEIIIGDNGSIDGSQEAIKKLFPEVILIENKYNFGSPLAINNCIKKSSGEFILRLDDDEIIEPDTIEKQVDVLKSNPKIGMTSCLYFYTEMPNILRSAGFTINLWTGKTIIHGRDKKYTGQYSQNIVRDGAGGGSHVIRRKTFEEVGLYDENYFLSYEDVDWCLRLKNAGYKTVVVGTSKLYHKLGGGMSQKENPNRVYLSSRGLVLLMKKNAGFRNLFFIPLNFLVFLPIKSLKLLTKKHFKSSLMQIKGAFSGLLNEKTFVLDKDGNKVYYKSDFLR